MLRAKIKVGIKLKHTSENRSRAAERVLGVKQVPSQVLTFSPNLEMYSLQDKELGTTM